jgi:hypothetical protein
MFPWLDKWPCPPGICCCPFSTGPESLGRVDSVQMGTLLARKQEVDLGRQVDGLWSSILFFHSYNPIKNPSDSLAHWVICDLKRERRRRCSYFCFIVRWCCYFCVWVLNSRPLFAWIHPNGDGLRECMKAWPEWFVEDMQAWFNIWSRGSDNPGLKIPCYIAEVWQL